jgi:hypothetical protein
LFGESQRQYLVAMIISEDLEKKSDIEMLLCFLRGDGRQQIIEEMYRLSTRSILQR